MTRAIDNVWKELGNEIVPGSSLEAALYHADEEQKELLEALKVMRDAFWGTSHNKAEDAAIELARSAIAKAEGA